MGKSVGDEARRTDLAAKRRKRRKDLEDGGEAERGGWLVLRSEALLRRVASVERDM